MIRKTRLSAIADLVLSIQVQPMPMACSKADVLTLASERRSHWRAPPQPRN
jgi:hypothetical protein